MCSSFFIYEIYTNFLLLKSNLIYILTIVHISLMEKAYLEACEIEQPEKTRSESQNTQAK